MTDKEFAELQAEAESLGFHLLVTGCPDADDGYFVLEGFRFTTAYKVRTFLAGAVAGQRAMKDNILEFVNNLLKERTK